MTESKAQQRVRVTCNGKTVEGRIVLASSNNRSLMLLLDGALVTEFGTYIGYVPVLKEDDGEYHELIGAAIVTIERVQ